MIIMVLCRFVNLTFCQQTKI